ncbi:sensor histidine kinase [Methylobacterium sp. JK268]
MAGATRRSTRTTGKEPGAGAPGLDDAFAAAIRTSSVPMVLAEAATPGHPIAFVNAAFCRLTGYSADELLGRDCALLRAPGTGRMAAARLRAAATRGLSQRAEIEARRKDGQPLRLAVATSPVTTAAGGRYAFAVITDLPACAPEDQLAALEAALQRRTALLKEVDHRAKNTLQVVASLVLLRARRSTEPGARAVLDRMAERIAALAAVQRLLAGSDEERRLDLQVLAREVTEDVVAGSAPGLIDFAVEVAPVLVPAAQAVPLGLLLHELAANAARHAFPEGRSGRVRLRAVADGTCLALEVADDGIGFTPRAGEPEGFGLSLVGMLVRQLGGTLDWDTLAPGTRARVVLEIGEA